MGSGRKVEITVDKAAEESVSPLSWGGEFKMEKVAKGEEINLVNARGGKIEHYGSRKVTVDTEGF